MRSISHLAGGISLAVGFSYSSLEPAFMIGAILGSKAPDFLELPVRLFQSIRVGIVPHRTITHWVALWALSTVLVFFFAEPVFFKLLLLGFFLGGLVHLIQDACTPMGVPIFFPFEERFSARLSKSWLSELTTNLALLPLFFVTGYGISRLMLIYV